MGVTVEPEGLASAAAGLGGVQDVNTPGVCQPPTAAPVSVWMATVLNSHWTAASGLLAHAAALRSAGGASLASTAHSLQAADEDNAAAISAGAPSALAAAMPTAVASIPTPDIPSIPTVPPPPTAASGEQLAVMVHFGPGSSSLRSMAQEVRAAAARVSSLASDTRRYGSLVDENWQDGRQQAGANVAEHAGWLDDVHGHLSSLASAADEAAGHVDTLIEQTPRPEEFVKARQRLESATAQFNASGGLNPAPMTTAMADLARKQSAALAAHQVYHGATATAAAALPVAPPPAPPIVRANRKDPDGAHKKAPGKARGNDDADAAAGEHPDGLPDPSGPRAAVPGADVPGAAAPVAGDPVASAAPAIAAQIAGTLFGAGTGTLGQLASGLQGAAAAPMGALSSLTSGLGDMGGGAPPSLGGDPGMGDLPDGGGEGAGDDLGGGDGAGGGGDATMPATAGPVSGPAVSASPVSSAPAAPALNPGAAGAPTAGAGGVGGMGMMPPMMGGRGNRDGERERDGDDRRVVLRPTPNTEPVFGELERRRSRRRSPQEEEER